MRGIRGLTLKTTLLAWSVTLLTLAIFVTFVIPEQKHELAQGLEAKARGVVVSLVTVMAGAAISEDYSSVVEHSMQVLSGDPGVTFLVTTKNDGFSVLIEREKWRTAQLDKFWHPESRQAVGALGKVPILGRRVFHYAHPFDYSGIEWGWVHVGLSLDSYDRSVARIYQRTGMLAVVCVTLSLAVSVLYARQLVKPILSLQAVVDRVAQGDLAARAHVKTGDEVERLAEAFNAMTATVQTAQQALIEAKSGLERRVGERTRELKEQIDARDKAHAELAEAQQRLIDLSRLSGMAEVATGVIHNVGNVLNSVIVGATLVSERLRQSRVGNLVRVAELLEQHQADLDGYLRTDPAGRRLMPYFGTLARHLAEEREELVGELHGLSRHVNHIKEIVAEQQTYARAFGLTETVACRLLFEDALRMSHAALDRHRIEVRREFEDLPPITTDRHKVLQILLNLIRNAKDSLKGSPAVRRTIVVGLRQAEPGRLRFEVADNGVGIAAESMTRVFSHGFTTKKDGHGFGLHSGALAARQMGGSLTAQSDGSGRGAVFTLELPVEAPVGTGPEEAA